jgi:hypothetical protein
VLDNSFELVVFNLPASSLAAVLKGNRQQLWRQPVLPLMSGCYPLFAQGKQSVLKLSIGFPPISIDARIQNTFVQSAA